MPSTVHSPQAHRSSLRRERRCRSWYMTDRRLVDSHAAKGRARESGSLVTGREATVAWRKCALYAGHHQQRRWQRQNAIFMLCYTHIRGDCRPSDKGQTQGQRARTLALIGVDIDDQAKRWIGPNETTFWIGQSSQEQDMIWDRPGAVAGAPCSTSTLGEAQPPGGGLETIQTCDR